MKDIIAAQQAPKPIGPYSQAVRANGFLFTAQIAQNLETNRKGERFTLIEPPLPPEEPVSPNRLAVLIIGLILSAAIAAGVAASREAALSSSLGS